MDRGEWFEKIAMGSLPERAAARWGGREALAFNGRRWTFAELSAGVDRVAKGLIALGIEPGERVALWMLNRAEWIEAAYAAMKIGAILLPVNTRFRTADVTYVLEQSESATLLLADRSGPVEYLEMVREVAPSLPHLRRMVALAETARTGAIRWEAMLAGGAAVSDADLAARARAVDPGAIAFLMYTSGTTGFPKGVMHDHRMVRNIVDGGNRMGITFADAIMMYLPLFHLFGFAEGLLMSMVTGARQVLTEGFDPDESLDLIQTERATVIHGFDLHYKALLEAQEKKPRDVSSVRTGILASGMSSSWPIAREGRRVFGPMLSGYGMSEFGVGVALSFLDSTEEQCVEASGYPAPGYEIRVIDPDTGRDQPAGVPGEILVGGYTVMRGYWNKPVETARTIDDRGFVHTGDMGVLRADGHLRFMGRYKDMLKIGGENVDPMEVEAYLMGHPAINLAAVVAYPDPKLSEVGVAYIRLEPGATLTEADVLEFCRGKIASFKIPRRVFFVGELPMTSSGKIQKVRLREDAVTRQPPATR